MKKLLMAAAGAAALTFAAAPADALVYIGYSINGGSITQVASGATSASVSQLAIGGANGFTLSAQGDAFLPYPELLDSTSIDVKRGTGAGTLDVYVTRDNLTTNYSPATFLSSFGITRMTTGWNVTLATYVDDNNGKFTTSGAGVFNTASNNFTSLGALAVNGYAPVTGTYSVTERYTIHATGAGQSNSAINMTAVPEPASWAMMITGFGFMGALMRRRRSAMATA